VGTFSADRLKMRGAWGVTVVINSDLLPSVGPDDGAPTICECMSGEWEADSTALVADLELITALYAAPGLVDGLISRLAEMFGIPLLARRFTLRRCA
jgi:hypothetical protein